MIVALMTLYKPDDSIITNVRSILPQVNLIYLCDNSPEDNHEMFNFDNHIKYVSFKKNLALSMAFNYALNDMSIGWKDEDYVIFFDQDSYIRDGHIVNLIFEYEHLSKIGIDIGCLGPVYFDHTSNTLMIPKMKKIIDKDNYIVSSLITSSMLVQYGKIKKICFWNEKIFLDMADWDLCWRFQMQGMKCVETQCTVLEHALGTGQKKIGPFSMRMGSPIREYYQTRNYLYLLNEKYTPLKYRIKFVINLIIRCPLHLIFLNEKSQRWHFVVRGWADYFAKKYDEYLSN